MSVKLDQRAFQRAKILIGQKMFVLDKRDDWSEHEPSAEREDELLAEHGIDEHQRWFLGIDEDEAEGNKRRYELPYGDFEKVHRCGVIAAEVRAAQYHDREIEVAAAHLPHVPALRCPQPRRFR